MPDHNPNSTNQFNEMRAHLPAAEPPKEPGYLQYWDMRAEADPGDERIANIVKGLTSVAIRADGEIKTAEYTNKDPALQARYWYRALGPLNPMTDVEPDLIRASEMMYGRTVENPFESANLQLDSAYALTDLAHVSGNHDIQRQSLGMALGVVRDIKGSPHFAERDAKYRLQTVILEGDLMHDALRLRHLGDLDLKEAPLKDYREYEKAFVKEELRAINEFGQLHQSGITDQNFGVLFEWYLILAGRHETWAREEIDTSSFRGATSRENAEWTGEEDVDPSRVTGNHDVIIEKAGTKPTLVQLKTVKENIRRYHPRVSVLDFEDVLKTRYANIDGATNQLVRGLAKFQHEYRDSLYS